MSTLPYRAVHSLPCVLITSVLLPLLLLPLILYSPRRDAHLEHRTYDVHIVPPRLSRTRAIGNGGRSCLLRLDIHERVAEVARNHLRSLHALEETGWRTLRRVRLGDAVDVRRDELDEVADELGLNLERGYGSVLQTYKVIDTLTAAAPRSR